MKLIDKVLHEVATEKDIPLEVIQAVYTNYWEAIQMKLREINLKGIKTEEEFDSVQKNFNLVGLGKFGVSWERFQGVNKRLKILQDIHDRNKEN